ncbi:MAG: class I SAM-dependent methyltransferase [Planctomycetota bacterium]
MNSYAFMAEEVKAANRRLYDAVAGDYERIDGRRGDALVAWIRHRLTRLAIDAGNGLLLDLGSGSGVVTRAAKGLFQRTIAMDISPRILATAGPIADWRIAADTDRLPIASDTVDVVSCFAVLHHLYDTGSLLREVARVLRPGGMFWSDHDMDAAFFRRFRWPLKGYRALRGADRHYEGVAGIDARTYELAEFRENGVDGDFVTRQCHSVGLTPRTDFHWYGLTGITNLLFGQRERARGWAPLLRIVATKPDTRLPVS